MTEKTVKKKGTVKKKAPRRNVVTKTVAKKAPQKKSVKKPAAKKAAVKKAPAGKSPGKRVKGLTPDGRVSTTPYIDTTVSLDDWTNTEKVILARRSVRAYKKKQVPEPLVRRILECGRFAPSAGNFQPWRFVVIRDANMIAEMEADIAKAWSIVSKVIDIENHPRRKPQTRLLQLLKPNTFHPIPMAMSAAMSTGEFKALFEAPTIILLFKDKRGISNPDLDLGICGQNMIIAAHSMGLGTCWLGVVTALQYFPKWKKLFNIRYPWHLEVGICMGYPFGEPNGFVHREVQYIDWFDDDGHRVVS